MTSPAAPTRPVLEAEDLVDLDLSASRAQVTVYVAPEVTVTGWLSSALPAHRAVDMVELRLLSIDDNRIPFRVVVDIATPIEVVIP